MAAMLNVGAWGWGLFLALGAVIALLLFRRTGRERASRAARPLTFAGFWLVGWLLLFGLLPEAALRGWLPGSSELSLCDESPGSGCGSCTAESEMNGGDGSECYREPVSALGVALGALGPFSRARAIEAARSDQRWMIRDAGLDQSTTR
jgi:hypothetical protein